LRRWSLKNQNQKSSVIVRSVRCACGESKKRALFIRINIRAGLGQVELRPVNIMAKSLGGSNLPLSAKDVDKMGVSKFFDQYTNQYQRRTAICKSINQ
jgi:hypothetical protein